MALTKAVNVLLRQLNRHGLREAVTGSQICTQAETLYPGLFRAVSVKEHVLHLEVPRARLLALKLIEGPLLTSLQQYCKEAHLPPVSRVRLTVTD